MRGLRSGPNSQRCIGTCILVHLIGSLNQVFASNIESSDIPVVHSSLGASFPRAVQFLRFRVLWGPELPLCLCPLKKKNLKGFRIWIVQISHPESWEYTICFCRHIWYLDQEDTENAFMLLFKCMWLLCLHQIENSSIIILDVDGWRLFYCLMPSSSATCIKFFIYSLCSVLTVCYVCKWLLKSALFSSSYTLKTSSFDMWDKHRCY